jgi:glycosyltransferase involved in cell wall biosynthesis
MSTVYFAQNPQTIPANTGIGRVIHAQYRYLKEFGWDITGNYDQADIIAAHANARDLPRVDVLHIHGLYWNGDSNSGTYSRYHGDINSKIAADARRARAITVPSLWVAEPFLRDMRIIPSVIGHGIDLDEWGPGDNIRGYALWNKNRNKDVCDPTACHELAARKIPVLSTFAVDGREIPQHMLVIGTQAHEIMRDLIRNACVYLATTPETFGIGTLEALASGVPVLGFRHGATPDLITHKHNGYLVEPGDYDGLADGYHWILEHNAVMRRNAQESAQDYAWPAMIAKYAALYAEVLYDKQHERNGVSIIITNYNYGQYLPDAVQSCLDQTHKADEIIVIDDGSTDPKTKIALDGLEALESVTVVCTENKGVAHARNLGIELSSQQHIVCLDADDMLDSRFIETLLPHMQANRDLGIAYTGLLVMHPDGSRQYAQGWPPEFSWEHQSLIGNPPNNCIPSACMFRKDMWARSGGYQQLWAPGEDAEFWDRGLSIGFDAKRITDEALFWYRIHANSASRTKQYKRVDTWLPWMRDHQYPFAAPSSSPVMVRSYRNPLIAVHLIRSKKHDHTPRATITSILGQTMREWAIHTTDVMYNRVTYPFVRTVPENTACFDDIPFIFPIYDNQYIDPQYFERNIRHFIDTGELLGGFYMGCACNSNKAAQLARQAVENMRSAATDDTKTTIEHPSIVRMEFIGIQIGARSFRGATKDRVYRGGRNAASRYADVHIDDIQALLSTEQWRIVPREAVKPAELPAIIEPIAESQPYTPEDAPIHGQSAAITEQFAPMALDIVDAPIKKPRGRPKRA